MKKLYWRIFYVLWTPVRWVAGFLWSAEWIPLGRFGPYILGAAICRWPNKVKE